MNPDNAWRLTVHNPNPEIVEDVPMREITNGIWGRWGMQALELGGDVTLAGRHGAISQIPELHEDELYFDLETTDEFELQYIMYHEREDSRLWQLLMSDDL